MNETRRGLPEKGLDKESLLKMMGGMRNQDGNWQEGRTWSLVYYAGGELDEVIKDAYRMFMHSNGLNPMVFPSLKKFENEVVDMAAAMLGGDGQAAGSMTSGGTESILMALKTARDWARENKPAIAAPEMVIPVTAHPAFEKAAHYLDITPVRVPVGSDFKVDTAAAEQAITDRTILMVGSAPAYPHGVIDPIEKIAEIAQSHGLLCHVDACVGGFLLPFMRKLGFTIPPFDFGVPGVTSISADIHKYGFSAKGASVVLYRNRELRRHQFFVYPNWPGGLFGSPTMTGTRPGGAIAAAWAVMNYLGEEGYMGLAEIIIRTARQLMEGINGIPGLRVLGKPDMSIFAFTAETCDVYALGDEMDARGWRLDRQQFPPSLHMMVTPAHAPVVEEFLADLQSCAEKVRGSGPAATGTAAMYGMMGSLPDRDNVKSFILEFMDSLG